MKVRFLHIVCLALLLMSATSCTADDPGYVIISGSAPPTYEISVAQGNIPGSYAVNKFGRNIEIDSGVTADIWDGGYTLASGGTSLIWVVPTQARIHDIVSSSASDDGSPAGVGARTLRVYGLTSWDTAEVSEDIILNGTTNVPTVNSYVIIHRAEVLTKGATNVNVGTITATAQTDNTITAKIEIGKGQTLMAIYGIPSTQKLYLSKIHASVLGKATGSADIALLANPEPNAELLNFVFKHTFGIVASGGNPSVQLFSPPKRIDGPAIIKIQAVAAANDTDISAGFDGILVSN